MATKIATGIHNLLVLDPADELTFQGPFNRQILHDLKVSNPDKEKTVFFKIKTTAPKLYCVRPNVGRLEPLGSLNVQIYLQPFKNQEEAKRHKFLIQATHAPSNIENVVDFWKRVDVANVWDTRLKCVLLPEDGDQDMGNVPSQLSSETIDTTGSVYKDYKGAGENRDETDKDQLVNGDEDSVVHELKQKMQNLEDEKIHLRGQLKRLQEINDEEIDNTQNGTETRRDQIRTVKEKKRGYFYFMATFISIISAAVGVYVGKNMI